MYVYVSDLPGKRLLRSSEQNCNSLWSDESKFSLFGNRAKKCGGNFPVSMKIGHNIIIIIINLVDHGLRFITQDMIFVFS